MAGYAEDQKAYGGDLKQVIFARDPTFFEKILAIQKRNKTIYCFEEKHCTHYSTMRDS